MLPQLGSEIEQIASPLICRRADETTSAGKEERRDFVHDTYQDFFLARYFAEEINEGKMSASDAYGHFRNIGKCLFQATGQDKFVSKISFMPSLLKKNMAREFVLLLFDAYIENYSQMFEFNIDSEFYDSKSDGVQRKADYKTAPFEAFKKYGNLRLVLDNASAYCNNYNVDYFTAKRHLENLASLLDICTEFMALHFLADWQISETYANLLILNDHPATIDFDLLAKLECINPEKTKALISYKLQMFEEKKKKWWDRYEGDSPEEDVNSAGRRHPEMVYSIESLESILRYGVSPTPCHNPDRFMMRGIDYWVEKLHLGGLNCQSTRAAMAVLPNFIPRKVK